MLPKWSDRLAVRVFRRLETILKDPDAFPEWKVEVVRRTSGLPVYADPGGVIVLTLSGDFVGYGWDSAAVTPVVEDIWIAVALSALGRQYPELRELLPERPDEACPCPDCSGSGWLMNGSLFCGQCRGFGWRAEPAEPALSR